MLEKYPQNWLTWYDTTERKWHSLRAAKLTSNLVIVAFVGGMIISLLSYYGILNYPVRRFYAVELAFSVLLISEITSLIFTLSRSVADSVGKQFEVVSLILLRESFKELGHLPVELAWDTAILLELLPILTDALGAVAIFLIIGLFYRIQHHTRITSSVEEQQDFVRLKKLVASLLLFAFLATGLYSLANFVYYGQYHSLLGRFYTILIFTDILILIISLRYSTLYLHLFRYSSFALATVIIRLSLTAPKYYNVLLSVSAGLFVLLVAYGYNRLNRPATGLLKS
ncbi:hypothetical protein D0N36_03910 [Hymenobacter lapidiphilus]|uniref:hypothetical protein n=1 Tax=Hymenobacter sp. CCM 8763 TaxID=2303334 RepID=UPI000E346CC0|nr:hypothetical protein [Hymenobacter sp. CCM 8763]RFP66502.1 hypothetical protein D0N36_03910 [Hymenobacter sp. CCM 8763]